GRSQEDLALVALAPDGPGREERTLWGATRSGILLKGKNLGSTWEVAGALLRTPAALVVSRDGSLTALCRDVSGCELLTSADGARWLTERLSLPAPRFAEALEPSWLVCFGVAVAIGYGLGVMLSRDGARSFSVLAGASGAVTAVFAG